MHGDLDLSLSNVLIRLLVSLTVGIVIGLEREIQHKAAGLRTTVLICLGATIFTLASIGFAANGSGVDPSRIAAGIVTGIGFLGAGAIIQTRGSVHGLTTAATIWVMAALGLAVGLGSFVLAAGGAVLALIILHPMQIVESWVKGKKTTCMYSLTVSDAGPALTCVLTALQHSPSEVKALRMSKEGGNHLITFTYTDQDSRHADFLAELAKTPGVTQVSSEQC